MNGKTILVFGAYGFIATYLIDELLARGHEVIASDVSSEAADYYGARNVEYVQLDMTRRGDFARLPHREYDAVVHLAACQPANVSERAYSAADYVNTNVIGTLNILDFCRENRAGQIVYASSHRNTQGLWASPPSPIREESGRALKYSGEYAMFSISESAAQDCVHHYEAQYGLPGIVFRLPPVYGYGPHTEIFKEGKPIKTGFQVFIDRAREGKPLEVWGDASIGRDIIYVKDVVSAFVAAIGKPDIRGLFNITSGYYLTLREQAETIARLFWAGPGEPQIVFRPDIPNGMDSFLYDNAKARAALDWSPRFTFRDMLLDYEKEAASRKHRHLIERRRNLFNQA
ncbi:MAG: NAD(P)-dependent oxidoreductase [Steroidobacteraceae bacterium]|nr:NAD(P)-dependent oxidoreductase [Steroidobacteraceae bacterium]